MDSQKGKFSFPLGDNTLEYKLQTTRGCIFSHVGKSA